MRLVIGSTGPAPAKVDETSMAAIEDRLNILYRGEARLALSVECADAMESALEIPLEWKGSPDDSRLA